MYVLLGGILCLGAFLRFYLLDQKSLWTDELVTISNASKIINLHTFLAHTRDDDLPKFYSLLLKFWMQFGRSDEFLRSLSVIFGCLSIPVTYATSRLFFDAKTSLAAALFCAISPFMLLYDREVRVYPLFTILSLLSTYFFIRSLRENRLPYWILYAVVNVLNVYTHPYAFLTIGVQWLYVSIRYRTLKPLLKPWLVVNGAIVACFMVRISAFISDVAYFAPWAIPRERFPFVFAKEVVDFFYILFSFAVGQTILPWNPIGVLIFAAVLTCFAAGIRREFPFSQDMLYLVLLVFLPIIAGVLIRISLPRYFTFIAPLLFMFLARGLWLLPKKIMIICAVFILAGWSYGLANYYNNKEFHIQANIDPWKDVAGFLKEHVKDNEEVYCLGLGVVPLRHYYATSLRGYGGSELMAELKARQADTKRFWLLYTSQDEYESWLRVREMLGKHYAMIEVKKWGYDHDAELKRKFFKKSFSTYRVVAELYERKD